MANRIQPVIATRFGVLAVFSACALAIAGCSHSILYDENRDRQGQEAVKAVDEARFRSTVESLEKTFADVAAREEANARALQLDSFNNQVALISEASSLRAIFGDTEDADGLITVLEGRFAGLGATSADYDEIVATREELDAALTTLTVRMIELRALANTRIQGCLELHGASADPAARSDTPSPRFLSEVPATNRSIVTDLFAEQVARCNEVDALSEKLAAAFTAGEIGEHRTELAALESEIQLHQVTKRAARDELDKALADFNGSGLAPTGNLEKSELERLEQRAGALSRQIGLIAQVQNELLPRQQVIATETLERLEALLATVAGLPSEGATSLDADDQTAAAIVRAIPTLADEADKLLRAAAKPRLVPFLAAIDHHRLIVEGFQARENAKLKQTNAARQQLTAAMNEAAAIADVLRLLQPSWGNQSIAALDRNLVGGDKAVFYRALAIYADDVQRFRIDSAVWGSRLRAARHEEALLQSKYAAAQWDGLLSTIAKVLSDYHSAGIKKAELAEFMKALGLVVIGVGAAQ